LDFGLDLSFELCYLTLNFPFSLWLKVFDFDAALYIAVSRLTKFSFRIKILRKRRVIMPIYEFRCLQCGHVFELFNLRKNEQIEMKCPECGGVKIERVMSKISISSSKGSSTRSTFRSCPEGTCSSLDIPGHEK
jgi:putative FmdB family regulatory protein